VVKDVVSPIAWNVPNNSLELLSIFGCILRFV
jgi:hypothetical protein